MEKKDSPVNEWSDISNSDSLRESIHETHNYLRNHGAGYGMDALKTFNLLYGLKRIEESGILKKTGLSDKCKFSSLVKIAKDKTNDKSDEELSSLINKIIMKEIYQNEKMRPYLFYVLPDLDVSIYSELIKKIDSISDVEEKSGEQLSGKIYEYFIGRDQTAISELGAYFTNRHIVNFIFEQLNIELEEDGSVPKMIDMFGGSGGFTIEYTNYINKKFPEIEWNENFTNVHHYDMNRDVVKSAALEYFCLTKNFPKENFYYKNSFTDDFQNKKYKYIITNPPYGGDKSKKTPHQEKRDKIKKYIEEKLKQDVIDEDEEVIYIKELAGIKKDEKTDKARADKQKVSMPNSSKRLKDFCKKFDIDEKKVTDKEGVSFIQLMEMLEEGGTACAVLKEGVFFDKCYKHIRKILIENFNVEKIISVPQEQFENTSTKTSIIIFHNTGKTEKIQFSEIKLKKYSEDKFEIVNEKVKITMDKNDIECVSQDILTTATYEQLIEEDYDLNYKKYNKIELNPGEGYKLVKLGDVCEFNHPVKKQEKKYKYVEIGDVKNNYIDKFTKYDKDKLPANAKNICNYGDILIASVRPKKEKIIIIDKKIEDIKDYIFSSALIKLTYENLKNSYYLFSIISILSENFEKDLCTGSNYPRFSPKTLMEFKIPIPKSKKKIEDWVDKISKPYTKKLDLEKEKKRLEVKVQKDIDKLLDENETEEVELGDLCDLKASLGGKNLTQYYTKYSKNGFITGKNLNGNNDITFINKEGFEICKNFTIKTGDILIQEVYNENSNCIIIPKKWNNYVFKGSFRFNNFKISNRFLFYYINSGRFKKIALKSTTGSIFKHLSISILKPFKITLPKDRKILETLNPLFEEIDNITEEIPKQEELYQSLLEQLKQEAIKN